MANVCVEQVANKVKSNQEIQVVVSTTLVEPRARPAPIASSKTITTLSAFLEQAPAMAIAAQLPHQRRLALRP